MTHQNKLCFACGSTQLNAVLDLGNQPPANSYLTSKDEHENVYPLELHHCTNCTHLQLSHTVDPKELFEHYLYVSGTSNTLHTYFKSFVELVKTYNDGHRVLDIACNDGTQLDYFKSSGYSTYGIDPAKNLFELSSKNHNVICDFLSSQSIAKFDTEFDIIIAQNVLAHNNYPKEFLEQCKTALAANGRIFIQTSQANMVENNEFDTIYHEHLSFFNVKSFCALAQRAGLKVIDIKRSPIHGTSFIFVLSNNTTDTDKSEYFISEASPQPDLNQYAANAKQIVVELNKYIHTYKEAGYTVIGAGAAAKGNTLLNFGKIELDYIIDDNALKQGLYTPGMKILICHPDVIINEQKLLVVPLAWNFFDEIKKKVLLRNPVAEFVKFFPVVEEVK